MSIEGALDFTGKVAVITGGSGSLCSTIARALGQCGANVVLVGRSQETLDQVAAEINQARGNAFGMSADVLD
ncbi:unnamed protein product, partial [marine sediment metagenome]